MSSIIGIMELAKSELLLTSAIYAAKKRISDNQDEQNDD